MRSRAALSSSSPPSTDCSASIECGGSAQLRAGHRTIGDRLGHGRGFERAGDVREPILTSRRELRAVNRTKEKGAVASALLALHDNVCAVSACTVSPSTVTVMCTTTSVCSATFSGCSPTCFSGPCGMRIVAFSTSKPCAFSASTMSALVTEPNRLAVDARFLRDLARWPSSFAASSCAAASCSRCAFSSSARLASNQLEVLGRRALRLALRDQEVAREAVLDLDDVAQVAEVRDLFEQDDLHASVAP